jgi:5-formyltetrahydrofolate cyclo-ligase
MLAFDRKGNRLGWGGGYYDKYGAANPNMLMVAIGYDEQQCESVPTDSHDLRPDRIITPTGSHIVKNACPVPKIV